MKPQPLALAWALAVLSVLSGCVGSAKPEAVDPAPEAASQPPPLASLDPADEALPEPARLTGDAAVQAHEHDWWMGTTSAVLAEMRLDSYGGSCGSNAAADAECGQSFHFPPGNDPTRPPVNVWPGTGLVRLHLAGQLLAPIELIVHPPGADDETFLMDSLPAEADVEVTDDNVTDSPHTATSRWWFEVRNPDGQDVPLGPWMGQLVVTAEIFRSDRPLPLSPPHGDPWNGSALLRLTPHKLAYDKMVADEYVQVAFVSAQSRAPVTMRLPADERIHVGTRQISVVLEWNNTQDDQPPLGIEVCDPTQYCDERETPWLRPAPATASDRARSYELPVARQQWDSPYEASTRWHVRWYFDNDTPAADEAKAGIISGTVSFGAELHR